MSIKDLQNENNLNNEKAQNQNESNNQDFEVANTPATLNDSSGYALTDYCRIVSKNGEPFVDDEGYFTLAPDEYIDIEFDNEKATENDINYITLMGRTRVVNDVFELYTSTGEFVSRYTSSQNTYCIPLNHIRQKSPAGDASFRFVAKWHLTESLPISWIRFTSGQVAKITQIFSLPDKLNYKEGESIDPRGLVLKTENADGTYSDAKSYQFSPEKLDRENKTVTVTYTDASDHTLSTSFTVNVSYKTDYTITDLPNKKIFKVGETFDISNFSAKLTYSDGTVVIPDSYICDLTKPLVPENNKVTITCVEKDIDPAYYTKIEIKILVMTHSMSNCKLNQSELNFECTAGIASVNLYNRRLLFEHSDVSLGIGTYKIDIGHVYNSHFIDELDLIDNKGKPIKTGMGHGFKLNVQQYLIPNDSNSYNYIDSAGFVHLFNKLNAKTFYDQSGSGLMLKFEGIYRVISDTAGNKLYFKDCRLIKSKSCEGDDNEKIYNYDAEGYLTEIYDARQQFNKVVFNYEDGYLATLKYFCDNEERTISFEYSSYGALKLLTRINQEGNGLVLTYDGINLKRIVSGDDESALFFNYTENVLNKVETGVYHGRQISSQAYEFISDKSDLPTYTKVKSIPENPNNVLIMVYYFNKKGFTTSILEDANKDMSDLKYPEKLPGTSIGFKGGETLENRVNWQQVHKSTNKSTLNFDTTNDLVNYRKLKYIGCKYFQVSFWLKLTSVHIKPKIFVTINSKTSNKGQYSYTKGVFFDNTAIDSWQYVTVPVEIDGEEITDISFSFEDNNMYYDEFADPRLTHSSRNSYYVIKENKDGSTKSYFLDDVKSIKFTPSNSDEDEILLINEETFITGKDIEDTYLSLYNSTVARSSTFTLALSNGRRKYNVKKASLMINDFDDVPFGFIDRITHKMALFNTETVTSEGTITSCVFTDFYPTFNGHNDIICKHTNSNRYNDKGEKDAETDTNVYCDLKGKVLREIDEYGLVSDYIYDKYGNQIRKKLSHPSKKEVFIYDASFTNSRITKTTAVSESSMYFNSLGLVTSTKYSVRDEFSTNVDRVEYTYDSANRLLSASNGTSLNNITYNSLGKISKVLTVNGNEKYGYKVEYAEDGVTPCRYFTLDKNENTTKILEKDVDYSSGKTTIKQYRTNIPDESEVYVDKYGKIIKTKQKSGANNMETTYERQKLWESDGASKVTYYEDPYDNKSYEYFYDEFNQPSMKECYYNYEDGRQSCLYSIKQLSGEKTEHYFYDARTTLRTIKNFDKDKILNPRITNVVLSDLSKTKAEYSYDALGRKKSKKLIIERHASKSDPYIDIIYSYKNYASADDPGVLFATNLKNQITFKEKENNEGLDNYIKIDYNDKGLVKSARYKLNSNSAILTKYEYDKYNRLSKETTGDNVKNYTYNPDGTLSIIKDDDNNVLSEYVYVNGKIQALDQDNEMISFSYDKLGNIASMSSHSKTTALEWERGSFLRKYGDNEYSYNGDGQRYRKKVGKYYTHYIFDGTKLLGEKTNEFDFYALGTSLDTQVGGAKTYLYDAEGIAGFTYKEENSYNDITFLFAKDHLDNVIAIYDDNGKMVAKYSYDSWGKCTIEMDKDGVGANNPIRWKSQYQDVETGLYFIDGRYYSPVIRQFLSPMSADAMVGQASIPNGLYAYSICLTNPINMVYNSHTVDTFDGLVYDPISLTKFEYFWFVQGQRFWNSKYGKWLAIGLAVAALVTAIVTSVATGCLFAVKLLGEMTLSSGVMFALTGALFSLAASNGGSFADNFVDYVTNSWSQALASLAVSYFAVLAFEALTSPGLCFKEGTLVETEDGLKPIEEIKEGDLVLAFDEQTGEQSFKSVARLFRNTTSEWYHITVNGEEIICTAEHPFYVVGFGFVPAKNLSVKDKLLSSNNVVVEIDSITIETLSTPETTYNFEVEDYHTYYVSETTVLVHNDCGPLSKEQAAIKSQEEAFASAKSFKAKSTRPAAVSSAVDIETGVSYSGIAGEKSSVIHPILLEQMPLESLELWSTTNCAEFNAVNNALLKGAKIHNLVVTTYKVNQLTMFPMCRNCQLSLRGVLLVVSG